MEDRVSPVNPRLDLLRREVEQKLLIPFRSHGWSAKIVGEVDHHDCIEIVAKRGAVATRIAVLYSSSGISNASYRDLSNRVDRIFFNGQPYMLDSFANGVTIPVEPLGDFFPFLVDLNRQVDPDRSPPVISRRPPTVRRPQRRSASRIRCGALSTTSSRHRAIHSTGGFSVSTTAPWLLLRRRCWPPHRERAIWTRSKR